MAITCAISNQKGGVCKTTTASVLSDGLVERGFKVLRVDMDPQKSLTGLFSIPAEGLDIVDFLEGNKEAVYKIEEGSYIVPGSRDLVGIDASFNDEKKFFLLKRALEEVKEDFDYILIDCPPAFGTLTINALVASDEVIVPLFADKFAIEGLGMFYDTFLKVKEYYNEDLKIHGALLTLFDKRKILHIQIREQLQKLLESIGTKLFSVAVRSSVAIPEMQVTGLSFREMKEKNKRNGAVKDYESFIDEFLKDQEEKSHA